MSRLEKYLKEYGKTHQNPLNIKIHNVCVPLLTLNFIVFYRFVPIFEVTLAEIFSLIALVYYFILDKKLLLPMAGFIILINLAAYGLCQLNHIIYLNLISFVLGWIAQFVGHKIEGKKPSFLTDIRFLLIGPLWVLRKIKAL